MRTAFFVLPPGFAPSALARALAEAGSGETSPKPLRGGGGPDPPAPSLAGAPRPAPLRRARFRRAIVVVAALGPFAGSAYPQELPAARDLRKTETPHLVVTTSVRPSAAHPGTRVSLLLDIAPKPKMHVYAPEQKELIPISLSIDRSGSFQAHAPKFPKGEAYFFEPLGETQFVYSKPFQIVQDVTIADTPAMRDRARTSGAVVTIPATVRYQACDDKVCYMPQTVAVSWTVRLEPPARGTRHPHEAPGTMHDPL